MKIPHPLIYWNNLSIRTKGFVVIALPLVATLSAIGVIQYARGLQSGAGSYVKRMTEIKKDLGDLRDLSFDAATALLSYEITRDDHLVAGYSATKTKSIHSIATLMGLAQSQPRRVAKFERLAASFNSFETALDALQQFCASHKAGEIDARLTAAVAEARTKLAVEVQSMLDLEDQMVNELRPRFERASKIVIWSLYGSLAAGCLASILGIGLFTAWIKRRVNELEEDAKQIAQGVALPSCVAGTDEIGRAASALAKSSELLAKRSLTLNEAKRLADKANEAKSVFLSRMSHELRTPLNSILGFGQILTMAQLEDRPRSCAEHIIKAGRHLLNLIDEVLDISRIETGRLPLSSEPVRLMDCVGEAMDLVRPMADARHVRMYCVAPDDCNEHVLADRQRLQQVLLNLLSNAVKYNVDGGRIALTSKKTSAKTLQLEIADTGIGILEEDLGRLFSPFERLGAEQHGIEGIGLGLAVSKGLIMAMGGEITVSSERGNGSVFTICLPISETPEQRVRLSNGPAIEPKSIGPAERKLLYIEDNVANMQLIEYLLGFRPGIRLVPAMQGRLGLELARQHRPDLILLDLHLPDMRGDEVLRHLRSDEKTRNIPVIIISADATAGQIERLKADGADEYLTKPLDVHRLLSTMDHHFALEMAPTHMTKIEAAV